MCKKLFFMASFLLAFSLVPTAPVHAELIGWWTLDEGSGDIAFDQSGFGNDGTLNGNPTWVEGYYGGALELNNSYVAIDGIADDLTENNFTVMAWIKTTMTGDGNVIGANDSGSGHQFIFGVDGGNLLVEANTINTYPPTINDGEWHHIAYTRDGTTAFAYTDGELVGEETPSANPSGQVRWSIGQEYDSGGPSDFFQGTVDDVKFFNHPLTQDDILRAMTGQGFPQAGRPNPADGEFVDATWLTMSWRPGDFAASHDVYMGESFEDVSNGKADTFIGNQTTTDLIVGFVGFPFPDGLVPGTTYYWRIDEVNDANSDSPWKGDVWSFTVPPLTAYNPVPADGARFVAPDATLSWTEGFNAKLHTVYFGESFDDVNDATGGMPLAPTTFTPAAPLEAGKTYYWRVDEFDPPTTYKGDVWSFEVAEEGGGLKGEYFNGMNFNTLVLTRKDPQIDFNWGNDAPDPTVGEDSFSVRWTGQVEAVFTETYTFYTNSDDGVRLWVDGKRLVNNWTDHGNTEDRGTIDLVAGQRYSVVMEHYENSGGAVAELRWESPRTPKQLIPAAALSLLTNAHTPTPASGIVGVKLQSTLIWKTGDFAASHEVYFGTDAEAVANATKSSPEFKGTKQLGDESLDPGMLAFDTDYFWRVDEVNNTNPDSPWAGNVWTFNTGDFLLVDDFEPYNDVDPPADGSNRIFDNWIDGFGTTTNGALVGNDFPPYAEQTVVHGGAQSMIYRYDNAGKTSEATLTLVWPRDWTAEGVTKLSLWLRGSSANAADRMFVGLNGTAVIYHDDAAATQLSGWNEWVIDLAEFGVDLTNVNSITIGIGTKNAPDPAGGAGTMYFDDIRLVP
jgi:hypothetical protein